MGAVVLLGIAGLGCLHWLFTQDGTEAEVATQFESLSDYAQADRRFREEMSGTRALKTASNVIARQTSVQELFAKDPRLLALSADEAAWLDRHYYPTREDLDSLASLDTKALRGTRDPRLATLLGLALVERKQLSGATAVLMGAAAMGSIYASEEAAVAERMLVQERLGVGKPDLDAVYRARLEVARILGDHTVQFLIDRDIAEFDMAARGADVQRHTTEFLRHLGDDAQLRRIPAPGLDPRPNGAQWSDLYQLHRAGGGADVITVYERK